MPYKDPEARREYQRKWRKQRRDDWIKANGPCGECGGEDNLEVDHKDPAQKVDHVVWSWSADRRAAELAKCHVLCQVCHLKKSLIEKAKGQAHGNSRFSAQEVADMRVRHNDNGESYRSIALSYGVSKSTVQYAISVGWK